jgi:hypothetical protein
VKGTPKFDYRRFTEHLIDRGMVDRGTVSHVLQQCEATGALLSEIMVQEGLVSDWEVARVVCELYHVPFLPLKVYSANKAAMEGLDPDYLRQYGLVPLDRFGNVLTVVVPGIVPSTVLMGLVDDRRVQIVPVVGSVTDNRRWLMENLPGPDTAGVSKSARPPAAGPASRPAATEVPSSMDDIAAALPDDLEWEAIFDAGEEAVQLELLGKEGEEIDLLSDPPAPGPKPSGSQLRLKGEEDD